MADVPIRCSCGLVRGTARNLSGRTGNRLACYCNDCQSFAQFLGRASDVLDANGGTDIFQISPAQLTFEAGTDHLACIRLAPGGMLRWYAGCCNTPIGNTMATDRMPFVGTIHSCMDHASTGTTRDDALGPVQAKGFARDAKGEVADSNDGPPIVALWHFARLLIRNGLRGDRKRSPFFDAKTAQPVVDPRVLSATELQEVEAARDAS